MIHPKNPNNPSTPNNPSNLGFSLVELMLAMVLLSIVIFGVVKLQTSNLTVSNTNKNELQAYFYANQGIEIVKSIGFSAISGHTCTDSFTLSGVSFNACDPATPAAYENLIDPFKRYFKISPINVDAYKVTSIIEWTDSTGAHVFDDGSGGSGAIKVSQIIY